MGTNTSKFAFFTEYADQSDDSEEIVIPESFDEVSDEDLGALHEQAVGAFNALYGENGEGVNDESLAALGVLTEGVERITAEIQVREEAANVRREEAAALAARVSPQTDTLSTESTEDEGVDGEGEDEGDGDDTGAPGEPTDEKVETLVAAPREIRVNLSGLRSKGAGQPPLPVNTEQPTQMSDIVRAAPEFAGFREGAGLDWSALGQGLDRRLASFNRSQWEQANAAGRHMRTQLSMAVIHKPFDDRLRVLNDNTSHIDEVIQYATKESRLPGNSLVASGGWCAPSQIIYDLCEIETRDGLFSLPEIAITRGGVQTTMGPNFADIFAGTGFCYTEQEDIDGDYDGAGGGTKPCYTVECPDFTDHRLDYCGLCINAGLLMQRGYPEVIARTVRGALVAHDHKMAAKSLAGVIAGSVPVTMPASQAGATAPILTAVELQVEHHRTVNRSSRSASLEAVFPTWVHGAIRADLARRLGVDLLSVSDSQINGWFADRGVSPQFVYGLQDLTGAPGTATAYPTTVQFLLYAAGTWVRGTSPIITLDTIYDSVLLGTNDYTALFTEEGILTLMTCGDSRHVTVSICPDGATHGGVDIACNGSFTAV